jgi:hypothetical protein
VGPGYGTLRAAGTALLLAAAVGAGGTAGMTSALAADPGKVTLGGSLVDGHGAPLGGIQLLVTEELQPDGGAAAVPATTAADGSFSADLFAWGTAAAPASVSISTLPDQAIEVVGESCSQTWAVEVIDVRSLALAEAAPEPIALTASTTLLGEICGTTGTPPPTSGGSGGAAVTPPPTDVLDPGTAATSGRIGPALTIGFAVGLLLAAALLLPRPGARRRG